VTYIDLHESGRGYRDLRGCGFRAGVRRLEAGRVSVEAELGLRGCARGGGLGDAWRLALVTADARELLLIDR
jgi:hypothetical protein